MDDIIQIDILDNDQGGHSDLKFQINGLTAELIFDTYYFGIANEPFQDSQGIKKFVADFLKHWVTQIGQMQDEQNKYLPIDIADQYTGCIKVYKKGDRLNIAYGTSSIEGWGVDLINPSNYFDNATDFDRNGAETIWVKQTDFINSIKKQIGSLV